MRKGDWLLFVAFRTITVGTAAAIYNSFPAFVYLLGLCVLREPFRVPQLCLVLVALGGVLFCSVTAFDDDHSSRRDDIDSPETGIVAVSGGAILFAVYQVSYKYCFNVKRSVTTPLLVNFTAGLIGLFSLLIAFPFVFLLDQTPSDWVIHEPLAFPEGTGVWLLIGVGLLGMAQNILIQLAMMNLSALLVSVFCLLSSPGSILADWIIRGELPETFEVVGTALLLVSVIGLIYLTSRQGHGVDPNRPITAADSAWPNAYDGASPLLQEE